MLSRPSIRRPALLFVTTSLLCLSVGLAQGGARGERGEVSKKLIAVGWDNPATADVAELCTQLEQTTPFDGMAVRVVFEHEGETYNDFSTMQRTRWQKAWLQQATDDLKSCEFDELTNNFIRFNNTPGDFDWSDDEGWATLANNVALLAGMAKEAGLKGLLYDPESYEAPQFKYDPSTGLSFKETVNKARQRGAELMTAMTDAYPDMTFLGMWLFSRLYPSISDLSVAALSADTYGLYPAFVNGMLDALPPTAVMVDATEFGYFYTRNLEGVFRLYAAIKNVNGPLLAPLLDPENRDKYQQQVQAGFAIYLDAYVNELGDPFYHGPKPGGTRLDRFRDTVQAMLSAADEYVWVYSEQAKWFPVDYAEDWYNDAVTDTVGQGRPWEEVVPGITQALKFAKAPAAMSRDLVVRGEAEGTLTNLVQNGSFENESGPAETELNPDWFTDEAPPGWAIYQDPDAGGTVALADQVASDGGHSVRMVGLPDAALIQNVPVVSGQQYVITADALSEGESLPVLQVNWSTAETPFISGIYHYFAFHEADAADGWQQTSVTLTAPPDMKGMVLLFYGVNQEADADVSWFDNVRVYEVDDLPN